MRNLDFELNISSEQFLNYMLLSPIGYLLIDQSGNILAVNQILLQASQHAEQDLLSKPFNKIISFEGTKDEFLKKLDSFSTDSSYRLPWQSLDGKTHYSKVVIWKTKKQPLLYVIGFLEISREKYLDILSRFAESFVSENNIGLIVIDSKQHILEISPLACKLMNVSKSEVINREIDEIFIGISDEHRIVQQALLDGIIVTNHAFTWRLNQQKYDLLIDSNVIVDEKGEIVGAYVVFKDVTNLRSLEQQVTQNDRLATIGQIAAGTAHEIRNPLTSIKGFLQILKNSLSENGMDNELKYTDIMLSEIDRINKLVNEILLLSKPKDVVYRPTDINNVLKALQPIINNESLLYGVEVNYGLDESLPIVIADSELLKQVFLNLAKNGIEAMVDGGELTISTKVNKEDRQVNIFIHDTGPGIPNYIVDKIFEPFFTTKDNGTGLGLPICQKIVHDLGGNIRVSTKGFGTTFKVSVPYI